MMGRKNRAIRDSGSDLNTPLPLREKNFDGIADNVRVDQVLPTHMKYILISPVPMAMSADAIYKYFNYACGEVEFVGIHAAAENSFAVVTFVHEDGAKMSFEKRQHTIAGCIVNVSIVDQFRAKSDLLILNDDCILEILEYLEMDDLSSMASMCNRLQTLTQTAISTIYKEKVLELEWNGEDGRKAENIIRQFGLQIQSLRYNGKRATKHQLLADTYMLQLLLKYCGSLKYLEMDWCEFKHSSDSDTEKLVPLFNRLDKLILNYCEIDANLFKICDVTELTLNDMRISSYDWQQRRFNRLKTLKIFVHGPYFLNLIDPLTSIEYFETDLWFHPAKAFCDTLYLHKMISKFENIKTLKLRQVVDADAKKLFFMIEQLTRCEVLDLSELKYCEVLTAANLLEIIRTGKNLQQLILRCGGKSEAASFLLTNSAELIEKMLDIVSKRPNKTPLHVILVGNGDKMEPFINNALPANALLKFTVRYHVGYESESESEFESESESESESEFD